MRARPLIVFTAMSVASLFAASARAQLHGDVGVSAGVTRRVLSGGAGDGAFGPRLALDGHVALLPLVRVGAYASAEIAPTNDAAPARHVFAAGVHARGFAPWVRGDWRAWLAVGLGYSGTYAPSYHTTLSLSPSGNPPFSPTDVAVDGSGGGHFEVPLALGLAYRFRKPWALTLEAGTLLGFGHNGTVYSGRVAYAPPSTPYPPLEVQGLGKDIFAPFAALGMSLDL